MRFTFFSTRARVLLRRERLFPELAAGVFFSRKTAMSEQPRVRTSTHRIKRVRNDAPLDQRLFDRVTKTDSGCWNWQGASYPNGYGLITYKKRSCLTHRLAYEAVNGPIAAGLFVCHRCDNPKCINPEHLFAGTARDNHHDMRNKGRCRLVPGGNRKRGEQLGQSKLTNNKVVEIRALIRDGFSQRAIASKYGVTQSSISRVMRGVCWSHVKEESKDD